MHTYKAVRVVRGRVGVLVLMWIGGIGLRHGKGYDEGQFHILSDSP